MWRCVDAICGQVGDLVTRPIERLGGGLDDVVIAVDGGADMATKAITHRGDRISFQKTGGVGRTRHSAIGVADSTGSRGVSSRINLTGAVVPVSVADRGNREWARGDLWPDGRHEIFRPIVGVAEGQGPTTGEGHGGWEFVGVADGIPARICVGLTGGGKSRVEGGFGVFADCWINGHFQAVATDC